MKSWYSYKKENRAAGYETVSLLADSEKLQDFVSGLKCLENVPLSYLLCSKDFAVSETIRFFWVDPVWTDCLVQGALSLGEYLSDEIAEGGEVLTEWYCGFLLCSEVVDGWDLDICCSYQNQDVAILRKERLANNLLICIAESKIDTVEFSEKEHAICIGLTEKEEGKFVLELVSLDEGSMGLPLSGKELPVSYREDGAEGVLDICGLVEGIKQELSLTEEQCNRFSALEFGTEMLQRRVRYSFAWDEGGNNGHE